MRPHKAISEVLERYMRVAPPKTRVLKFRKELQCTLESLTLTLSPSTINSVAFYPDVPLDWQGTTSWKGFEYALNDLFVQKP
jgi:hypothetical protein